MIGIINGLFSGVGRLIMGWSKFYGTLFGSLFGIMLACLLAIMTWHSAIYMVNVVKGEKMYDLFMWDRDAELIEGTSLSETYVYYGGGDETQILASTTVTNSLDYPIAYLSVTCSIFAGFDDDLKQVTFHTSPIAANTTERIVMRPADGTQYIGIISGAAASQPSCEVTRGRQSGDFYKPKPE